MSRSTVKLDKDLFGASASFLGGLASRYSWVIRYFFFGIHHVLDHIRLKELLYLICGEPEF